MRFFFFFFILLFYISCKQTDEPTETSEYISKVFDYVYAPGQHSALAAPTDTEFFIGNPDEHTKFVYLGGFGGYIIAGFDHNISNHASVDFEVLLMKSSTPEPAIVYVMQDKNGDGIPNETWYELKGSQFENSKRNYWVRYFKSASDTTNITWLDSEGVTGELKAGYGSTNSSGWWWQATTSDSITFYGTRLPDAYENTGTESAQFWVVPAEKFKWGYAENNSGDDYDATTGSNKLDISNAVDENGNAVSLTNIRFLKIQTAVFQQAGWVNEVSAELRGAREIK